MTNEVRVGVIGAGSLGMRHCRTLAQLTPAAHLVAVADVNERAAQDAASLSPGAKATSNYRSLLDDPSIQAIVIVTPNDTHAQIVAEAAEAKKDIFCEKPLGLDLSTVDAPLAAVAKHNVRLQIGFQRRFDSTYREAKRAIAAGELGDIELVVGTTRDPAPPPASYLERSGSFFADTAIHDYDSIRFLTGLEVTDVVASAASLISGSDESGARDTAVTSLRLENGALAAITNSRRSNNGYDVRIEILGSRGRLALGDEPHTPVGTSTEAGAPRSYWDLFEEAYVAELQHFVECVANDEEPQVTGEDGRRALEIALGAERSVSEGRMLSIGDLS